MGCRWYLCCIHCNYNRVIIHQCGRSEHDDSSGVIGLIVGMLIVKDKPRYWDIVLEGLGDKMAMTAVLIWLWSVSMDPS